MPAGHEDADRQPTRDEIESREGPVVLEFGARWCGHCQALAPRLARLLEGHPKVHHLKVEDGPGRRLGRSFRVKLWPTLVFLRDGQVVKQVARPELGEVREGLVAIAEARSGINDPPPSPPGTPPRGSGRGGTCTTGR